MKQYLKELFSAPFQLVLVLSFSMVAAITIAIGTWAIAQSITDYLEDAMTERVARDMKLAQTFYVLTLRELEGITQRLSQEQLVIENLSLVAEGSEDTSLVIDQQIENSLSGLSLGGNHLVAIVNANGDITAGRLLMYGGGQKKISPSAGWNSLDIIAQSLSNGEAITTTEVLPAEFLEKVGLADQAKIEVIDTSRAAATLFDPREGTAGLGLVSVSPIKTLEEQVVGTVLAIHLFNNDFTLVDRIKEVADIETATIFFGDMRISTNVMDLKGERAIGTRVSEEVSQTVLVDGKEYVGPAFVVNENYITRYDPIKNYAEKPVGILYVGAKQASFYRLVSDFNQRIGFVAFGTILLTFLLAIPVSRVITRPLKQLKELVAANRRVAAGDMSVRVPVRAGGEVGLLESSFNTMLDTMQTTHEQLVQSEKLASLGQLAAGVAHELNNPLGTILLYSDLLSKEVAEDSVYKADLERIVNETKRCKNIVASLLEFARQNQVNAQTVDLNQLIVQVLEIELKHYEGRGVEFIRLLEPSLPNIQADASQLMQVLVNLIENAADAMPEGGRVTLRTLNEPENMVTIEVEDSGIGIPPENLSKLFTPFFTTKPVGKGIGLGLAIIYGIIKMHRGQIIVRSAQGVGTTFIIQLPIRLQILKPDNRSTNGMMFPG